MMTAKPPVTVAYVYDRHISQNKTLLQVRIDACITFIEAQRWQIGGYFLDQGEDATSLDHRPALDHLCNKMRSDASQATQHLCLVYELGRFANDQQVRDALMRRIFKVGGSVQTIHGQRLSPNGVLADMPTIGRTA